jgi:hypothetical protein
MGAWGEDVFENDTAGDWTDQFEDDARPSIVSEAIAAAIRSKEPDADVSSVALAAAEIIAASRGQACRGLPEEIKTWLAKTRFQADDKLAERAARAVARIADCSELAELWEHAAVWRRGLVNLNERLQLPAKPVKHRVSAASRNAGIGAAKKAIGDLAGHLRVDKAGIAHVLFPDDLTDEQLIGILQKHAAGLATVEDLVLKDNITDRSLAELHRLPRLSSLYLEQSSVTDVGMPDLQKLTSLQFLSLAGTALTDAGLLALVGSKLRCVAVQKTKVTAAGIKRFQQKMPGCFVGPSWEWGPHRLAQAK